MPKSRTVSKQSPNGEVHFILPEYISDETAEDFDETEIGKIMKKEASKTASTLRAE